MRIEGAAAASPFASQKRSKPVDGDRRSRPGYNLGPHHAAHADRRALRGEHLLIADIEMVAGSYLAAEVDRRGESPLRFQHLRGRHASRCQRCVERTFDGALHGNFARERLTRSKARRLIIIA
jgi:hypothetical protein